MRSFRIKRGFVDWDWYFSERMETSSECEKDTKRKDQRNIVQKLCTNSKWASNQNTKKAKGHVCQQETRDYSVQAELVNFTSLLESILLNSAIMICKEGAKYATKKYLPPPSKLRGVTFHRLPF